MSATDTATHLYWATGCTSCLRVKEFLERTNTSFVSHNVVRTDGTTADDDVEASVGIQGVDPELMDEMAELGLPQHVPIVRRGEEWADGKDLKNVAELLDIDYDAEPLPVGELYDRLTILLETTQEYLEYLPDDELETHIPNRPRSYADLVQHIYSLPDVFMMHEAGVPMTGVPRMEHDWDHNSKVALRTYGSSVQGRLDDWFESTGQTCDWSETADVFWGQPTKHEFFERTTWHTGQHVRQLEWVLQEVCGVEIENPLDDALWEDLPMPEKVWNDN
ncbi:DinB family protein [Halohasta litorea]|uniref:DinB family protein n=1 Tax=Halohasta litorea TaxID=869891 RepID=A0ABD6DAV3_9EURY|nr:DinB family protein [Halohasta litorea]